MDNSSNVYHPSLTLSLLCRTTCPGLEKLPELTVVKPNKTGGLLNGFKFLSSFSQFKK